MDSISMMNAVANTQTAVESAAKAAPADKLANEETFLQLLVAQIKNQDPLKPADGVQFLSQLAQFSQLEQLIGIRAELGQISPPSPAVDPSGTGAVPTN